jgi:sugar O-acyltransferase (sialic acid O-acetyltransferase NeuD family)
MQFSSSVSLLIIGAGGHAVSCIDVVEQIKGIRIVGLVGLDDEIGKTVCGYSVMGADTTLSEQHITASSALVAVGHIRSADVRLKLYKRLTAMKYNMPVILSPHAYCSAHSCFGSGTIVMHGAIINASVQVGVNCIINSRALLEHGVTIGDHCHVSTGAVVNGDAMIGEESFIGSGAVIREGVRVGRRCVIGMGALVRRDLPDGTVFYGTPLHES